MRLSAQEIKQKVLPILQHHRIKKAALFGSFVRREMKEDSDIDILVEIEDNISLLNFVGIKLELEEILRRKVDLVEYSTIKPFSEDYQRTSANLMKRLFISIPVYPPN
jgi:predicted nucleotidyltransferase